MKKAATEKGGGFNQRKYINEYNKNNYINKSIRFKKDEAAQLEEVLKKKKTTLKNYIIENVKKDLKN